MPADPLDLLSEMQRAFVLAYVGPAKGNGSEAARRAGYAADSASVASAKLLKMPKIRTALVSARGKLDEPFVHVRDLVRGIEQETVRAIAARDEAEQQAAEAQRRTLMLADREAVVDALMSIALAKPEKRKLVGADGREEELALALPKRSDQVAAARALAAMEGWDAPVKVAGKVDHAHAHQHSHSGRIAGLPSAAELESMTDAEIEQRLALLEQQSAQQSVNQQNTQSGTNQTN